MNSSNVIIMAALPGGIIFHLADLARLDWAGGTIRMKTFKMKGGSQYTGDVERGVCVEVCRKEKAQLYPTV